MKKSALLLCVLMLVICLGGLLYGCNNDEGQLYTLEQAYEQGWLSVEDLQQIADGWNGTTDTQNLDALSGKSQKSIKNAFKKKFNSKKEYPNITTDEVKINSYYGAFGDCIVISVVVSSNKIQFDYYFEDKEIGGIFFEDYCGALISVYK